VKVTKQQQRRLAAIEAKFNARSARGLLPITSATRLSDAYHALEELDSKRRRDIDLMEEDDERHERLDPP
jgi:hypothetical protein